jgi:hypothetical protein
MGWTNGSATLQGPYDTGGDLGDLQRMSQSCAIKVTIAKIQNLGLTLQSSERSRVYDPCKIHFIFGSGVG